MADKTPTGDRYTVRKQVSGYTGRESWYVYDRQNGGRVTVHAHIAREGAVADAEGLNRTGWDTGTPASEFTREDWDEHFAAYETAKAEGRTGEPCACRPCNTR